MEYGEDDPKLVAEGELALARLALDSGDLSHAARHISYALASAPTLPEAHETLTRLAAHAGDSVLELFPVVGDVYVGAAVAHAHLVAAEQPSTAFDLLIAATQALPSAPWAAVAWIESDEFPRRWDADELAQRFMRLAGAVPEPVDEQLRPALEPYLRLARRAVAAHPDAPLLLGAASAIARRFECVEEAVDWAARAARTQPSLLTQMWLGYAYRAAGRVDDAVEAWRAALRYDPHNLALHTDIAEILATDGRLAEAIEWVDRALAVDPADDYALPTACVLRHLRDGEVGHLVALSDHLRARPDSAHAATMLARACRNRRWLGGVTGGDDAVSDLLRQLRATDRLTAGGSATLTALEPPSAMLTLERTVPGLRVTVCEVPAPDIRQPRRPDGYRLWQYRGTNAQPAVPAPSEQASATLSGLAATAWAHPVAAYDAALGLAGIPLDDLVRLLAHPPAQRISAVDPGGADDPSVWVRTVQTWACLGILHHGADEPWRSSRRRRLLVDLAFGIEDWVTEAAVYALVTAAWMDPGARADVAGLVRERLADALEVGRRRPVSIMWSLARLALVTPELDADTRRAARLLVEDPVEDDRSGGPAVDTRHERGLVAAMARPGRLLRRLIRRRGTPA